MHTKSSLSKLWIGRWLLLTQETGPREFHTQACQTYRFNLACLWLHAKRAC